ncbi:hypothetical protein N431DRAFT_141535 [Stipitochalara longipes BDJ]|nr:hypothetical protein N431DRAFT_141535 [Stipitochalara longipes BDJ]
MVPEKPYYLLYPGESLLALCSLLCKVDLVVSFSSPRHGTPQNVAARIWHAFCILFVDTRNILGLAESFEATGQDSREAAKHKLRQWLQPNSDFLVEGYRLGRLVEDAGLEVRRSPIGCLTFLFDKLMLRRVRNHGWGLPSTFLFCYFGSFFFVMPWMILVITPMWKLIPKGSFVVGIIIFRSAPILLTSIAFLLFTYVEFWIKKHWLLLDSDIVDRLYEPQRLVSSESGFLGMEDHETMVGDKICMLEGLENGMILREIVREKKILYTVVGKVTLAESGSDQELCPGFDRNYDSWVQLAEAITTWKKHGQAR